MLDEATRMEWLAWRVVIDILFNKHPDSCAVVT